MKKCTIFCLWRDKAQLLDECYEHHHGMSYSLSEIAELLGVKKGTV
ncbi:hypothetical protein [Paenibacillus sp. FSL H7-0331]|nr:hypothetical protein [Paenibacillus sp. FSL H7-0331]